MIRLTYQEVNNLVNKTKASFYIAGLPENDCINTGSESLYDYNLMTKPDSVIITKTYDRLVLTRTFKKRPMALLTVALLFIYVLAVNLLAVAVFGANEALNLTSIVLLLVLILPMIFIYPYTRRRIFLYQVIAYKVDALSDVIDGKIFILQTLAVMLLSTLACGFLAYYKEFNLTSSITSVVVLNALIFIFLILIMMKVFYQGNTKMKFNHKEQNAEEEKTTNTHVKSEKKMKYKVNRAEFLNTQKEKKNKEVVKVEEKTVKELEEIASLINEINTAQIKEEQYVIKPEDIIEEKTILIDHSQVYGEDNLSDLLSDVTSDIEEIDLEEEKK